MLSLDQHFLIVSNVFLAMNVQQQTLTPQLLSVQLDFTVTLVQLLQQLNVQSVHIALLDQKYLYFVHLEHMQMLCNQAVVLNALLDIFVLLELVTIQQIHVLQVTTVLLVLNLIPSILALLELLIL